MTDGKLYYSISEVSDAADVKPHVLRYWETQFKMLRPKKNRAGNRQYRTRDMNLVLTIRDLLYRHGYTIAGARRKLLDARRVGILVDGQLVDSEAVVAPSTPARPGAVSSPATAARRPRGRSAAARADGAPAAGAGRDGAGDDAPDRDASDGESDVDPGQLTFADAERVSAVSEVRRELESLLAMLESTPGAA